MAKMNKITPETDLALKIFDTLTPEERKEILSLMRNMVADQERTKEEKYK